MRLISRLFVLFLMLKILGVPWVFAQDSYPAQQAECVSNTEVSFVCGLINPEDLYQIPDTDWVIATGRISDSAGPS